MPITYIHASPGFRTFLAGLAGHAQGAADVEMLRGQSALRAQEAQQQANMSMFANAFQQANRQQFTAEQNKQGRELSERLAMAANENRLQSRQMGIDADMLEMSGRTLTDWQQESATTGVPVDRLIEWGTTKMQAAQRGREVEFGKLLHPQHQAQWQEFLDARTQIMQSPMFTETVNGSIVPNDLGRTALGELQTQMNNFAQSVGTRQPPPTTMEEQRAAGLIGTDSNGDTWQINPATQELKLFRKSSSSGADSGEFSMSQVARAMNAARENWRMRHMTSEDGVFTEAPKEWLTQETVNILRMERGIAESGKTQPRQPGGSSLMAPQENIPAEMGPMEILRRVAANEVIQAQDQGLPLGSLANNNLLKALRQYGERLDNNGQGLNRNQKEIALNAIREWNQQVDEMFPDGNYPPEIDAIADMVAEAFQNLTR